MNKYIISLAILNLIFLGCDKNKEAASETNVSDKNATVQTQPETKQNIDTTIVKDNAASEKADTKDIKKEPKVIKTVKNDSPKTQSKNQTESSKSQSKQITKVETTQKELVPKDVQKPATKVPSGKTYSNLGEASKHISTLLSQNKDAEAIAECSRIIANPAIVSGIGSNIDVIYYLRISAWFKMKDYNSVDNAHKEFIQKFPGSKYVSGVNSLKQGVDALRNAGVAN